MECHDVRSLLTFAQRGCENLDVTEREALTQHLDKCPDCACIAQADRRLDETLGKVMRDVPVPAELKRNVLRRLATQRRPIEWKRVAIAAAVLLAMSGATAWYASSRTSVQMPEVLAVEHQGNRWTEKAAREFFDEERLHVDLPADFDYQKLERVDVVHFKKRPVAKLSFRGDHASAYVLVLPHRQFHTDELLAPEFLGDTRILIDRQDDFTYLVYYNGDVKSLKHAVN